MRQLVLLSLLLLATNGSSPDAANGETEVPEWLGDGARRVDIVQYPHQLLIIIDSEPRCGGVILTEKFVLTVARCFKSMLDNSTVQVRYGFTFSNSNATFQHREVARIIKHSLYEHMDYYDIAIAELSSNLKKSQFNAWPAVLPAAGTTWPDGTEVTIVGWGLPENSPYSVSLLAMDLSVLAGLRFAFGDNYSERTICTGPKNYHEWNPDQCIGNVGETLVLKNSTSASSVVVGILLRADCLSCPYASLYINIAHRHIHGFITNVLKPTTEFC